MEGAILSGRALEQLRELVRKEAARASRPDKPIRRRHVYSQAAYQSIEYSIIHGTTGGDWASIGNASLRDTVAFTKTGTITFPYKWGSEENAGFKIDIDESTPHGNGNMLFTKTGRYRFTLDFYVVIDNYGTYTFQEIDDITDSAGSPSHYHDFSYIDPRYYIDGPTVVLQLYQKKPSIPIAIYEDETDDYRSWIFSYPNPHAIGDKTYRHCWTFEINATDGDRFSIRATVTMPWGPGQVLFQDGSAGSRLRVERIGAIVSHAEVDP